MANNKQRLDVAMTEKSIADSRQLAQSFIIRGLVKVNGVVRNKPGYSVGGNDIIELSKPEKIYVSRGGIKLEHALKEFDILPEGYTVIDAGASTGGFTDCVLKKGAARVYAVDVGKGQLDYSLRTNPSVVVIEGYNIRYLKEDDIPEKADLITADVSFISLEKILPALSPALSDSGALIALIKPQFEAGKGRTVKGVVKDRAVHIEVMKQALSYGNTCGLYPQRTTYSPIKGPSGNIEFFIIYTKQDNGAVCDPEKTVDEAWTFFAKEQP